MKSLPTVFLFSALLLANLVAGPRDEQWKKVDAAADERLPETAIRELDSILAAALAEQSYAEATRALVRKIGFQGKSSPQLQPDAIRALEAEIAKSPPPMRPALEAILANWYWRYFLQHRWTFAQRTRTTDGGGADIAAWDLPRMLAAIDGHFTAALADAAALEQIPIGDYADLLSDGTVPDAYRPTLFDFLAYNALQFYQAGEQGAVLAEDAFVIEADGPAFAPVGEFLAWRPVTTDSASPLLKAVKLYQQLLRFHQGDANRSAYLDTDLARLTFAVNAATSVRKADSYQAALETFLATAGSHEASARARALLAEQLRRKGELARAHAVAFQGLAEFPTSAGGVRCEYVLRQIEQKTATLSTEFVWSGPENNLQVTYANLTRLHVRVVPASFAEQLRQQRWALRPQNRHDASDLLRASPVAEWVADLPATSDFQPRTETIAVPATLPPGFYFVIASASPDFQEIDNLVNLASFWVSDLALVTHENPRLGVLEGVVAHASTGEPLPRARVTIWRQQNQTWTAGDTVVTDAAGCFTVRGAAQGVYLVVEHGGQAISNQTAVYAERDEEEPDQIRGTVFFTDRAIYRPGQTIRYKGLSLHAEPHDGRYGTIARTKVVVVFTDANEEEIARATHETNDFGSFSGVFTAPRDGLMGVMRLKVESGPEGETALNVEEYKRPKFEVVLAAPAAAPKLGESVEIVGTANAYTGANLGGAKVAWRVERDVTLPSWCWWWRGNPAQAIAHGTAVTDADGTFKVSFPAVPDDSVAELFEPVFSFSVHADVVDTTGETRSADRSVRIGYTTLQASLAADDWQTPGAPVAFTIGTSALDGTPQAVAGTLRIRSLRQPDRVHRARLNESVYHRRYPGDGEPPVDPANPASWPDDAIVADLPFRTDVSGQGRVSTPLAAGIYRATLDTTDRFGKRVTARQIVEVIDPAGSRYGVRRPGALVARQWTVEPGGRFTACWGTGYESGRALVELACDGRLLRRYWTEPGRTQSLIDFPVTEAMRGGATLRVTAIRENRLFAETRVIDVPWTNKELDVTWERFRSKLVPGQPETWTASIRDARGRRRSAEFVATLYDAALDEFAPHRWPDIARVFRREPAAEAPDFANSSNPLQMIQAFPSPTWTPFAWQYRSFRAGVMNPYERDTPNPTALNVYEPGTIVFDEQGELLVLSPFVVASESDEGYGYAATSTLAGTRLRTSLADTGSAISVVSKQFLADAGAASADERLLYTTATGLGRPDLDRVSARSNLNETAFFLPHVTSRWKRNVKLPFTMPDTLTRWNFLGFAHDRDLRLGSITAQAVTAKDLMIEPNPPRFVREGDAIEFTVKVSNQSEQPQSGRVRLTFADAATLDNVDPALGNQAAEQAFDVPAKQSRTYSWRIAIPDGMGFLTYKAVGATDALSDGEEGFLPVLSRRILVTESLPLPVRGKTTREFDFTPLLNSGESSTLRHQSLTVQMVSQPAWYAVMSLPYLMEYPYECSEQLFNRLYANALARHVANSDPRIRRVFDLWKNTPALASPLQQNADLKSVLLEETPWLRDATAESAQRRNVGLLFDPARLDQETAQILGKLAERQGGDGLWSWFPGGRSNEYISLYLLTGFGRLRHLGVELDAEPALRVLAAMDAWMDNRYQEIQRQPHPEEYVPGYTDALFLYGRSFFLKERPLQPADNPALNFFLRRARAAWPNVGSRQTEAHLALALHRFGDSATPAAIAKSLKERSVTSEELGMFWREGEGNWWWYQAPIETQAMMIEVFAEVAGDDRAVADCQAWLLKQKQTQNWKTTKATADAVYALLLRGDDLLASDALVEVSLGGALLQPEKVEAGTGFYEQKLIGGEIKPALGRITVKKTDDGVSWGSVTWQYLEDPTKVPAHEGTPLKLKKALFVKENTARGPVLKPVTGPVAVGDELVVRLELRTDRDMEYVHLKDQRGSGTEPVNVLSGYRYQDGLAYYESTRDTASHFFIDYLPKGTYVFEYSTRVQLKGSYQSGLAEIQCMYAPEFNSHSESVTIRVE